MTRLETIEIIKQQIQWKNEELDTVMQELKELRYNNCVDEETFLQRTAFKQQQVDDIKSFLDKYYFTLKVLRQIED